MIVLVCRRIFFPTDSIMEKDTFPSKEIADVSGVPDHELPKVSPYQSTVAAALRQRNECWQKFVTNVRQREVTDFS